MRRGLDFLLELVTEMLDHGLDRHGSSIPKRANCATHDVLGHIVQQIDVFWTTLTMLDGLTPILFIGGCQDLYLAYFFVERNLFIRQLTYMLLAKELC